MAFRTEQNALSTTAEVVFQPTGRALVAFKNLDATIVIYIGDSAVDSSTGWKLAAGESTPILELTPGEVVYAVAASGTPSLGILKINV